ncbi:trypsin-like peptidase domain-containing protein [Roseovarius sp. LXJ103]|nr:trypsin-like peptidase domain-containing protein [Roseovarius carneus]PWE37308.1 peptidoglycan-binding protein [Pelagicola sp. LXJ1103]
MGTDAATAQDTQEPRVWVQIEAQPNLTAINEALRRRSSELNDVNGFFLGGGWYGVALGPYPESEALRILRALRAEGRIPRDSYIARSSEYQRQIWPVGQDTLPREEEAPIAAITAPEVAIVEPAETVAPAAPAEPEFVDETPREARAAEAQLSREERAELQELLRWAGFYTGSIDAAFGPGTRGAMSGWQEENNFEATGILTTMQRAELARQYNAVLVGMDLATVSDPQMGIEMLIPTGVVTFQSYEPPFAHFESIGDIPAKVLMISQEGTEDTLFGLYDIMQTLEIVPPNGPRERGRDTFTLVGESATMISHTEASLQNGQIKGFTLLWPAGDEERRTRVLSAMLDSFTRTEGVLDPAAGSNAEQSIDLVSGLEIRKPKLSRSGFYVDRSGTVVTTTEVVQACERITLDEVYEAEVASIAEGLGIAILRPTQSLAPLQVAAFQEDIARLNTEVAVAGYSYGGVLGAPSITYGQLADVKGLNGEPDVKRLTLAALDGDVGGPVFDTGGAVLGMLLPRSTDGRKLPDDVSFVADAASVSTALREAGITIAATSGSGQIPPAELKGRADGMTVLVSCWE